MDGNVITEQHWKIFRFCDQDNMSKRAASEKTGIPVEDIRRLMKEMRQMYPELFPVRTERCRFSKQNMPRDGYKLLRIGDIDENDIKEKL